MFFLLADAIAPAVVEGQQLELKYLRALQESRRGTGSPFEAVLDRYFVMPGQACSYKLGQLKILKLRKEAMERLGGRFDLRQFHADMIKDGALPLSLLKSSQ